MRGRLRSRRIKELIEFAKEAFYAGENEESMGHTAVDRAGAGRRMC